MLAILDILKDGIRAFRIARSCMVKSATSSAFLRSAVDVWCRL